MTLPEVFLSYARVDDEYLDDAISWFHTELQRALRAVAGSPIPVFQDKKSIEVGERWTEKTELVLRHAKVLIAILTPNFFNSRLCRAEILRFLELEANTQSRDLIIPIYSIDCDPLEIAEKREADDLARHLSGRQFLDWRSCALNLARHPQTKHRVMEVAKKIHKVIKRTPISMPLLMLPTPPVIEERPVNTFEPSNEVNARSFASAQAIITISTRQTLIVANPKKALLGFREVINRLWEIDRSDNKQRAVIWVLDAGRRTFDDEEARLCFLNVEALRSRFKALKSFDDQGAEARWRWLQSRVVIVLRDVRKRKNSDMTNPHLTAEHILLKATPDRWMHAPSFRALYGDRFDRLDERSYSAFLIPNGSSAQRPTITYFGHSPIEGQSMCVQLPSPHQDYDDAMHLIAKAADCILMPLSNKGSKSDHKALLELQHLGFTTLRLRQFFRQ